MYITQEDANQLLSAAKELVEDISSGDLDPESLEILREIVKELEAE